MNNIIKDLISMGYREVVTNFYAKPVGFHFLTFEIDKLLFTNWFKGKDNSTHIWNSDTYTDEETDGEFLGWIKSVEMYTRINAGDISNYEFINQTDILND